MSARLADIYAEKVARRPVAAAATPLSPSAGTGDRMGMALFATDTAHAAQQ